MEAGSRQEVKAQGAFHFPRVSRHVDFLRDAGVKETYVTVEHTIKHTLWGQLPNRAPPLVRRQGLRAGVGAGKELDSCHNPSLETRVITPSSKGNREEFGLKASPRCWLCIEG